jgi:pseudouridine kinase
MSTLPGEELEGGPFVLVIGAMAFDAKGKPEGALAPGTSTPGTVRLSVGGVARNIAENLARLGTHVVLMSAVGDDAVGHLLLDATTKSGVDTTEVIVSTDHRTGAYIAVLDRTGVPAHAIDDVAVIETLTPQLIYRKRRLFRDAAMVVIDSNVPSDTMSSAFRMAKRYERPVCIDPVSASLAPRVRPHLPDIYLMAPNLQEAAAVAGSGWQEDDLNRDALNEAQRLAMRLVDMDVEIAIITMAEMGLYYATSDENGRVPALERDIIDLTGAGDALTAAVIFGLLNEIPISEAVRLGVSAAALTIQCPETVCPHLSLERLYDELVI